MSIDAGDEAVADAWRLLAGAARIAVLTGAGISTDSGIPDFRGPEGLWTKDPDAEKLATISHYLAEPEVRRRAWQRRLASIGTPRQPNAGHRALVDLERQGRLLRLVTQNVDGLHAAAGTSTELLTEIHGSHREAECVSCGTRWPVGALLDRVRAGEPDPPCEVCGGIVKPAVVFFGEGLDPDDVAAADVAARDCDALLAIGSTLEVFPAAAMVPIANQTSTPVVILNGGATSMDHRADVVVRADISSTLPLLVAASN